MATGTTKEEWFHSSIERAWSDGMTRKPIEKPSETLMKSNPHEIALELLSRDWLKLENTDLSTRLYLVEEILPVLVLSIEELLMAVSRRGLEEQEGPRDDFNPVNFIAEFLMRNNPRYPQIRVGVASSSRYHIGLKEVRAKLKSLVICEEENVIDRVREELRGKRAREEEERRLKRLEEERRVGILRKICSLWQRESYISPQQIQQVTQVWLQSRSEEKDKFQDLLNAEVTDHSTWNEDQLMTVLLPLSVHLSSDEFNQFTDHLVVCGNDKKRVENKNKRRSLLKEVFHLCDTNKLNVLDRKQLMNLFIIFYDHANQAIKQNLTNPRIWPGTGRDEAPQEEWEREGSSVSDEDYQTFMSSPSPSPAHVVVTTPTSNSNKERGEEEREDTNTEIKISSTSNIEEATISDVRLPSGPGEQWSPTHVDVNQFLQLCDLLLGEDGNDEGAGVDSLSAFLKSNFLPDDSEISRVSEPVQNAMLQLRKLQKLNDLFTFWNSDCSGYLHEEELLAVLSHWKQFGSEESKLEIEASLEKLGVISHQINRSQFTSLLDTFTTDMTSNELKEFFDCMNASIKLTHEQQQRSAFRQGLLLTIKKAGYGNIGHIGPALDAAVKAIQQDCRHHGGNKHVSVCMGLLERGVGGGTCLSYKASSDDGAYHILGRKLQQNHAPVSFGVIKSCHPIHVPNVHKHGRVFFFIPEHSNPTEYHGSLVVCPILSVNGHSVGTISVDSLVLNMKNKPSFTDHEIAFYQGVGMCLGEVHDASMARKKLLGAAEAGMSWLLRRCPIINKIEFYLIRPEENNDYVLQMSLCSSQNSVGKIEHTNEILRKKDNFFSDYLFQCVDTSESVSTEVYCHPHLCCPLRDTSGCTIALIDLTLSEKTNTLDAQYTRDINKMIKLLTTAFHQTSDGEGQDSVLVLFHQLLLTDLQRSMNKLDKRAFAELRSYVEPPPVILSIIRSLIMILYPWAECNTWNQCKPFINVEMLKLMVNYSPPLKETHSHLNDILTTLKDISPKEVFHHGSLPTKYLYTWVSACSAVMEHSNSANIDNHNEQEQQDVAQN